MITELDLEQTVVYWESLIQKGRGSEVCARLTALNYKSIPRKFRAKLAEIARRILLGKEAIRILYPIIHNDKPLARASSDNEKTEYAAALIETGLTSEAETILNGIDGSDCPKALLYYSFLLFKKWDYIGAIPKLRDYVALESDKYKKIVGEINLASALVFAGDYNEAAKLLQTLIKQSKELDIQLLTGSSYELLAQIQYRKNQGIKALDNLNLSFSYLKKSNSMALLYSEKWRFLIQLKMNIKNLKQDPLDEIALTDLKRKAQALASWETLRDLDKQIGLLTNNHELINKVYYGTTHSEFRRVFLQELPKSTRISKHYYFGGEGGGDILDLTTCLLNDKKIGLKPGGLVHKLLIILASDFYRPFPVGEIFSNLYPDEYYNPQSSPDRVHKIVKRFRQFFSGIELPLSIEFQTGAYFLKVTNGIRLMKTRYEIIGVEDKNVVYLKRIPQLDFSAAEAADVWQVSKRTANRIIKDSIAEKKLNKSGRGPSTRFKKVS